jgi:adenylate cyclase
VSTPDHRQSTNLAILFADVSGSTKLYETLGNTRAETVISKTLDVLRQSASRHQGTVVKNIGDELMCTFPDAITVTEASQDMQRSLQQALAMGTVPIESLHIRVGFHYGPVIPKGGDVFGDAVNVAARVVAQTKKGQILTTKETKDLLPSHMMENFRYIDRAAVKGKKEELDLFEVIWEFENLTIVQNIFEALPSPGSKLKAEFGATSIELSHDRPSLLMGRGMENDFVIPEPLASRTHARIEFRKDRFVLVDQSINGTFVHMEGEKEVTVRRDELILKGKGLISLGKSSAGQPALCVSFSINS